MQESTGFRENSQAVQAYLQIMQSVIQRMSANSASCKAWCITLVSAILVIVSDKGKPDYAYIAIIPTVLFLILDSYYLALERAFRQSYNDFVDKIHNGIVAVKDLHVISPKGDLFMAFVKAHSSFSIWPFYLTLVALVCIAKKVAV